jgi:hypothetical protein
MFGITTDYEYSSTHKRDRLDVWSGPFYSVWEAEALSLPKRDGYMLRTYNGDRVRVTCPVGRTDDNWQEIDAAISDALTEHHRQREAVALHLPTD